MIKVLYAESRGIYGSPRITVELQRKGYKVGKNRVARIMREAEIIGKTPKPFKKTTDSDHDKPIPENLLDRKFEVERPNKAWVTDITYIPTSNGWLYLAVILDLFSRKVVGWETASHMNTSLCLDALDKAVALRNPEPGLIHHSDRGSQYASDAYQRHLKEIGATCSMSRRGNCWDNAVAESFFGTIKNELGVDIWTSRRSARKAISKYIHHFYNPRRLHSANGQQAPNVFEQRMKEAQAA